MELKIEMSVDRLFVQTMVNCMLGMVGDLKFEDVFSEVTCNPDVPSPKSFKISVAAAALYHVLLDLYEDNHDLVKQTGALIATTSHHIREN